MLIELSAKLKKECVMMTGELLKIPLPRKGIVSPEVWQRFLADINAAQDLGLELLSCLAGMQCEQEDRQAAQKELNDEAREVLKSAQEWITERKAADWQ